MKMRYLMLGLVLSATACTPAQIAAWEAHNGFDLTPEQEAPLLALDDHPFTQNRTTYFGDGSIVTTDCVDPAAPEDHIQLDVTAARRTYHAVACQRGWTVETIRQWERFIVDDVILRESNGCYNVRRGGIIQGGVPGCPLIRQGRFSDAGYFQVIGLHYNNGGALCVAEGLCSADDIVATPASSMTAGLWLIERNGKQPWCFSGWARSFHPECRNVPARWVNHQ